jgi:hypothetical protein
MANVGHHNFMEVVATGFVNLVVTTALVALIMGAIGGVLVWRIRSGLALGGLAAVGVYLGAYLLVAAVFLGFPSLALAVLYGIPSLALTFLISFLTVRHLEARANLHPIWATLSAFASALIAGFLWILLFRFSYWAPVWVALGTDVYLILFAIRNRKLVTQ